MSGSNKARIFLVDNDPATDVLSKGTAKKSAWRKLLVALEEINAGLQFWPWFAP